MLFNSIKLSNDYLMAIIVYHARYPLGYHACLTILPFLAIAVYSRNEMLLGAGGFYMTKVNNIKKRIYGHKFIKCNIREINILKIVKKIITLVDMFILSTAGPYLEFWGPAQHYFMRPYSPQPPAIDCRNVGFQ